MTSYKDWRVGGIGDFVTEEEIVVMSGTLQDDIDVNSDARHSRSHTMTSPTDHTSGSWKENTPD